MDCNPKVIVGLRLAEWHVVVQAIHIQGVVAGWESSWCDGKEWGGLPLRGAAPIEIRVFKKESDSCPTLLSEM